MTVGIDSPLVCPVGVKGLWNGGLCELRCCVWRSISGFEGAYILNSHVVPSIHLFCP